MEIIVNNGKNSKESLSGFAYRVLKANIIEFKLLPQTIINEGEIADILGISRTPVHEAVLRLNTEGLIDIIPRKESRISAISISAVNEGVFARSCIEPRVLKNALNNISSDYIKLLLDNLNAQKAVLDDSLESRLRFFSLDEEFHRLFYKATGKIRTYEIVKSVSIQYDRVRMLILLSTLNVGRSSIIFKEHQEYFNSLVFQSIWDNSTEQSLLKHICCLQEYFDTLINLYPTYFSFD